MNILDVVYVGVACVTAPWWFRKARGGWSERFAFTTPSLPEKATNTASGVGQSQHRPRVLVHAVSVGEVAALRSLVPCLIADGAEVVVASTTDTGLKRAQELYGQVAHVVRYPLDASWAVARFLDAVQPDAVGLIELEVWPNFIRACCQRGVPVGVFNGRLSERSFRGYRRIARWMGPSFASLQVAAVQDQDYAERFIAMGTPADRVRVSGSMKFDAAAVADRVDGQEELARDLGIDPGRPLVVGGSTGPGEEAMLHQVCQELGGDVQLLCAPRRPERFDEAASAMPGCVRRSQVAGTGVTETGNRFLLDTIGELRAAYALADVVVVGRSFPEYGPKGKARKGLGGSDPIEPIALGKATVFGPDCANFKDVVTGFVRADGLLVASDPRDLHGILSRLLTNGEERAELARRGREWIDSQQGASKLHAALLMDLAKRGALAGGRGGAVAG